MILVGAFALSNGNNAPATNATATPILTATPTPTPTISPTAIPSTTAAPTATPTATPTPLSGSGIRQTEFGYYITYPPFSENEVHPNPNYVASSPPATTVQFENSSYNPYTRTGLHDMGVSQDGEAVYIIANVTLLRSGSLDGAVNVHVSIASNSTTMPLDCLSYGNIVTFGDGQSTALMPLSIDIFKYIDYMNELENYETEPSAIFQITPDSSYNVGPQNTFALNLGLPS